MLIALAGTVVLYVLAWVVTGRRRDGVVPAAILGGVVGLVLRHFDLLPGSVEAWQDVGYHLFGISFLAIGLTTSDREQSVAGGAVWIGISQGMAFALQAAVGGVVTLALVGAGRDLFPAFGFLAPMGLEEGPGQAVSIGSIWESAGFVDAPTLGATIASVGFVAAYGLGLVALWLRRRRSGRLRGGVTGPDAADDATVARMTSGGDTGPGTGTGGLVWAAVAVVAGYAVLYWVVSGLAGLAGDEVRDTVLGVLFFLALLVGMAVRGLARRLGHDIAPAPQQVLTLVSVDGLTVAILASLAWARIARVVGPLAVVLAATLAASVVAVVVAARHLARYRFERSLALFGTITGTVSSGLALVSLADPDQATPVAVELGGSVVVSAPLVLAGVAVATAAAQGGLTLVVATGIFAVGAVVAFGALAWTRRRFDSL